MTNVDFREISQFRDVESLNYYQILQDKGLTPEQAFQIIRVHSRDNGRTPMQWSDEWEAGFTDGTPWIGVNENYRYINAKTEQKDENSIFFHYKKLVEMRKTYDAIAYGDIQPVAQEHPQVLAYKRTWKTEELLVVNNFYGKETVWDSGMDLDGYECILENYPECRREGSTFHLRPYESAVLLRSSVC